MKKKYKLKFLGKVVFTLIGLLIGKILYHYLGVLGHYVLENTSVNIFILVGWILLIAGEFILIYAIWEE